MYPVLVPCLDCAPVELATYLGLNAKLRCNANFSLMPMYVQW